MKVPAKAGRHVGYCHIEKLHNLEALPSTSLTVACFPVKIERDCAGWTRAVAIFEQRTVIRANRP